MHHSRECRNRLEKEMIEEYDLSKKLEEEEEQKSRYLARQVETADQGRTAENAVTQPGRPAREVNPQEDIVSWIECPGDRRSLADVHEEEH